MSYRPGTSNPRDLINHGPGKGDADRTDNNAGYRQNLLDIFPNTPEYRPEDGWYKVGEGRRRKVYK